MINLISFFIKCDPPKTSHHAKKIVRTGKWTRLADTPKLVEAKASLDALLEPHQPAEPMTGPVSLYVSFTWPYLASDTKKARTAGYIPHTSKPDLSNVLKTLEDRLVRLRFIEDDRKVVQVTMSKWRGPEPGISVLVLPYVSEEYSGVKTLTVLPSRI